MICQTSQLAHLDSFFLADSIIHEILQIVLIVTPKILFATPILLQTPSSTSVRTIFNVKFNLVFMVIDIGVDAPLQILTC